MSAPRRKLIKKLKDKYRLIIYNDNTFEEVGYIRLSAFNLAWVFGMLAFVLIAVVFFLIAFTGVRELIPGYPDSNMRRTILVNAMKVDSLEKQLQLRDRYLQDLSAVIRGENPALPEFSSTSVDSLKLKNINFSRSDTDDKFRKQVEEEEEFNLSTTSKNQNSSPTDFARFYFFKPVNGVVTNVFNADAAHYGTDIATAENTVIKSVLDGTVVMSSWTLETGYVIQIQHSADLISVYKHCAILLKKQGDRVKAGESIGIVGNSGELSTGPHLHIELWHQGRAVNPQEYIAF
jgi:murein DD-endopeptidase MepM/ murein hydrolase activator NlpD